MFVAARAGLSPIMAGEMLTIGVFGSVIVLCAVMSLAWPYLVAEQYM